MILKGELTVLLVVKGVAEVVLDQNNGMSDGSDEENHLIKMSSCGDSKDNYQGLSMEAVLVYELVP